MQSDDTISTAASRGGFQGDGAHIRVAVRHVNRVKVALRGGLPSVRLRHGHSGDLLAQKRIESGRLEADLPERDAGPAADPVDQEANGGQGRESNERQLRVEDQHHHDDAGEFDDVADGVQRARPERFADGIDVVGHPGDQTPNGLLVVKAQSTCMEKPKHVGSQVVHRAGADHLEPQGLQKRQRLFGH